MDKIVEYIGLLPFLGLLVFLFLAGFNLGSALKEYPSEEEMMRRIIQGRIQKRISEQVETEVQNEINRQAAGGNIPY